MSGIERREERMGRRFLSDVLENEAREEYNRSTPAGSSHGALTKVRFRVLHD
jgi:hypothetical protein